MTPQEEIRRAVKAIYRPGDVVEVRAFDPTGIRRVGRYPLGWDLVRAIEKEDQLGRDVYYVLNPTALEPLPIAAGQAGTKETDVPRRRWFLLDMDPVRKNKLATNEQFEAALKQARDANNFLNVQGTILASSGNGAHLLIPVDLPNDEASKERIRRMQRVVATKFSTEKVICECFPDAARLVRSYGTLNKKGTESETLKHRRSGILDAV